MVEQDHVTATLEGIMRSRDDRRLVAGIETVEELADRLIEEPSLPLELARRWELTGEEMARLSDAAYEDARARYGR